MNIWAQVNEADISRVHEGMEATFTIEGFRGQVFRGKVSLVRLNAQSTQNVVTYTVVVDFDNPDLKVIPYMTANVELQVASHRGVLTVPNVALRWKPDPKMIATAGPAARASSSRTANVGIRHGRLWIVGKDGYVRPIRVDIGLTDGSRTEITGPDVKEGLEVVVGEATTAGDEKNPFLPQIRFGSPAAPRQESAEGVPARDGREPRHGQSQARAGRRRSLPPLRCWTRRQSRARGRSSVPSSSLRQGSTTQRSCPASRS